MPNINLVNPQLGNIQATIKRFGDGQISAHVDMNMQDWNDPVFIKTRLSSYQDMLDLMAIVQSIRGQGYKELILVAPFILGGRGDLQFSDKENLSIRLTANLINSCGFSKVYTVDAHSPVMYVAIDNCQEQFTTPYEYFLINKNIKNSCQVLIAPDAGGYKRLVNFAKAIGKPLYSAVKYHDFNTDKPIVHFNEDVSGMDCVIVDDICDGGRTFIHLAKLLREKGAKTVTLCVTHGMFFYGTKLEGIDMIYTTNSYREFKEEEMHENFKVIDIFI